VRLHRGVASTEKGELLYQHAKRVLHDVAELESALRSDRGAISAGRLGRYRLAGRALQDERGEFQLRRGCRAQRLEDEHHEFRVGGDLPRIARRPEGPTTIVPSLPVR
jgi:hypothetical protein